MTRVTFFRSLGVRLAGLILVISGITLIALTEVNRRAVERILGQDAEVQAAMAIAAVAQGLESGAGGIERLVRFVARDLEGRRPDFAELERRSRLALIDSPNLFGFGIALEPAAGNPAAPQVGLYVHRSNTPDRFATRDLATPEEKFWERDWYQEAIAKGQAVWSEPFFDREGSGRNAVRLAAPFFPSPDDEKPAGVVSAVVDLEWLRRLANTNEFADTAQVIVFSRTGRLLLHPRPSFAVAETMETLADKSAAPELAAIQQQVIARRQGALTYRDALSGRRLHANYKPVRAAGWGVVVAYDEAEFLQSQSEFRTLALAFLAATLLLLAGIVIGVVRHALRSLGPLAAATAEIGRGNLDCEIAPPARPDEIRLLAQAFRAMRDALKAQHLERRWAAQAMEHQLKYNQLIIDSIGELVFVLTKALNISRINPAVTRTAGYTSAELLKVPLGRVVRLVGARASDLTPLADAMKAGQTLPEVAVTLVSKDGAEMPARLTLAPLFDNNRVVGGVVTLRISPAAGPHA
jgi:sigma-B regulation protein RsbU (phosphoserine phosphatase)